MTSNVKEESVTDAAVIIFCLMLNMVVFTSIQAGASAEGVAGFSLLWLMLNPDGVASKWLARIWGNSKLALKWGALFSRMSKQNRILVMIWGCVLLMLLALAQILSI